jgi:hypothetical protein
MGKKFKNSQYYGMLNVVYNSQTSKLLEGGIRLPKVWGELNGAPQKPLSKTPTHFDYDTRITSITSLLFCQLWRIKTNFTINLKLLKFIFIFYLLNFMLLVFIFIFFLFFSFIKHKGKSDLTSHRHPQS